MFRRRSIPLGVLACLWLAGGTGCDEHNEVFVDAVAPNEPPLIVKQGPEFPEGTPTFTGQYSAPAPWVLVGDPNGLDDISAVFFDVDSIRLHGFTLRPGVMEGCARIVYEPGNVLDTPSVPLPAEMGGRADQPMSLDRGGIYRIAAFDVPTIGGRFPGFEPGSGCAFGGNFYGWLTLVPPAAASPTLAFVTAMEVEYLGLSVTVYDKAGASATTTFPNLRLRFETPEETATAP